jgi:hypothetical protein
MDVHEVVARLNAALGATLVTGLAGGADPFIVQSWSLPAGPPPDPQQEQRLRFAFDQWQTIAGAEGEDVARHWFVSSNPWLQGDTPVDAIRDDGFMRTEVAVAAMVIDTFSG